MRYEIVTFQEAAPTELNWMYKINHDGKMLKAGTGFASRTKHCKTRASGRQVPLFGQARCRRGCGRSFTVEDQSSDRFHKRIRS